MGDARIGRSLPNSQEVINPCTDDRRGRDPRKRLRMVRRTIPCERRAKRALPSDGADDELAQRRKSITMQLGTTAPAARHQLVA